MLRDAFSSCAPKNLFWGPLLIYYLHAPLWQILHGHAIYLHRYANDAQCYVFWLSLALLDASYIMFCLTEIKKECPEN